MAAPGIFITEVEPAGAGPRLAVKDILDTAGIRTTYGSAIYRDHVPEHTAESVRRLEAAGYATVGKANLHEFAFGVTSENPHFGTVPNPIAPGRVAGGSSGGSAAALAAGLADAALGTDTAGSVRIPAACCGVVGFKPTFGLVSADGCFPLAPSFDHVGPMARSVSGCVAAMRALAPELGEPCELQLDDLQIGIAWLDDADPLVSARVAAAAAAFPHRRELDVPAMPRAVGKLRLRETAEVHMDLFAEHRERYGETLVEKLRWCFAVSDRENTEGIRARELYREQLAELLEPVDLLLTPTLPCVAPPLGAGELAIRDRMTLFTYPFNAVGAPAIALPCGAAEDGLPASVQIAAPPGADAVVLAAARLLEEALGHTADPYE